MEFLSKMLQMTPSGAVVTPQTAVAVKSIDYSTRLNEDRIITILVAGIPMMTAVAASDSQITEKLFIQSRKPDRSKDKGKHRKHAVIDYFAVFGEKGRLMSQAIAAETGTSETDTNSVMAFYLPTFVDAIAEQNPRDEEALADQFRADIDEAKSESPAFADMAMKMAI